MSERIDLTAILFEARPDLAAAHAATCEVCGSSISDGAPCPFCGALPVEEDAQLA